MPDYTYLIVGGGMTADAAVQGIRDADTAGTIGLISAEPHPPYNRPPLSKGLWKGEAEETIWRKTANAGAELHLARRAVGIDLEAHTVTASGSCSSPRGARSGACLSRRIRSSISARSTTTAACARSLSRTCALR